MAYADITEKEDFCVDDKRRIGMNIIPIMYNSCRYILCTFICRISLTYNH